jgi:hypothetical protein
MMMLQYFLDGYVLTLHNKAFLVYVNHSKERLSHQDTTAALPDWVFHSDHTIWLLETDDDLYHRALDGERIKAELMSSLSKKHSLD